jgi:tRNA-splicing ligase RtcB
MQKISEKIFAWLDPASIEPQAKQQLFNIASLPFVFKHIAVMPDCHLGKGATVGSVIATEGAIIPAAVGVDIGCGMIAVRTRYSSRDLPDNLKAIRFQIERDIPLGAGHYNRGLTDSARKRLHILKDQAFRDYSKMDDEWERQLGSLGSGNHFIEICLDENDQVWVVLHSGSRGIGNRVAMHHIKVAQRLIDAKGMVLTDRDLAYLQEKTREFDEYIEDLLWCQHFALLNREEMMDRVMACFEPGIEIERINCHHNFTQRETHFGQKVWVTRKGAIQMCRGMRGVIPGSMGTQSYIVSGLENELSYHSAPHGAGRRMSRHQAKKKFSMSDFESAMRGIECRHSSALIDELPGAYKDIDEVMQNSKELVTVEHTLKQIVNVKGD